MERTALNTEHLRIALRVLGVGGREVHVSELYRPLDLVGPDERRESRELLKNMLRHGEVQRISDGVYTYNFDYRPRERPALDRIWRFVRKEKPGWRVVDVEMKTGVGERLAQEYVKWLERMGYIEVLGRAGQARLFRATPLADQSPEAPYPPSDLPHPFEKEQKAALKIVGLMLRQDVNNSSVAEAIAEACRTLLARFEKNVTENENEENDHVA